jgi:hypothetical protein
MHNPDRYNRNSLLTFNLLILNHINILRIGFKIQLRNTRYSCGYTSLKVIL